MIFIDLSVPEPIAQALKVIRKDVVYLYDVYQPPPGRRTIRVPDSEWLARAGREGWLVISRDHNIRHRPGERRAIVENNVGAFILAHGKDCRNGRTSSCSSQRWMRWRSASRRRLGRSSTWSTHQGSSRW